MEKLTMNHNPNQKLTLSNAREIFRKSKIALNLSAETIEYYENCISAFEKFYGENNLLDGINLKMIENYILYLKNKNTMNDITVNSNVRRFASFPVLLHG